MSPPYRPALAARAATRTRRNRGRPSGAGRAGPMPMIRRRTRPASRRSITLLQRTFKSEKIHTEPHGGSQSWFLHKSRPSKALAIMKKINAANTYLSNYSFRLVALQNQQAFQECGYLTAGAFGTNGPNSDLAAIAAKINSTAFGTPGRTTNYAIESVQSKFFITNQESVPVIVTIYDVISRRDDLLGPATAFPFGLKDESNATSTGIDIGATPFNSQLFTAKYKVLKQNEILMPCGTVHEHNVYVQPNKIFKSELLTNADQSLGGITMYTLIVVKGTPVDDASHNVGTSAATINVVYTKNIRYTWSSDTTTTYTYNNNLPTFVGSEFTINEVGAVINDLNT